MAEDLTYHYTRYLEPPVSPCFDRTEVDPGAIEFFSRHDCLWAALAPSSSSKPTPHSHADDLPYDRIRYLCDVCGGVHKASWPYRALIKLGLRMMGEQEFVDVKDNCNHWSHSCHHHACVKPLHACCEDPPKNKQRRTLCVASITKSLRDGTTIENECTAHDPPCKLQLASVSWTGSYRHYESLFNRGTTYTFSGCSYTTSSSHEKRN